MKTFGRRLTLPAVLLAAALFAGCSTESTVATRKQERPMDYESLSPEDRSLVDQGKIRVGMDTNAVYLAWGAPGQVTEAETEAGETTSWSYYGAYLQQVRSWSWRRMYYDYYPMNYISAQALFTNGVVKQWEVYPSPVGY